MLKLNRPYLLSAANDLRLLSWQTASFRGVLFFLLCCGISIGLYFTTSRLLFEIDNLSEFIYLPYDQILGLFLLFLWFALTISNLAIGLGRFYHSNDLDLYLAAPVRFFSFFSARLFAVLLSSSWMTILFLAPVLLAFMQKAGQNTGFTWLLVIIIFIPYFVLPGVSALILGTFFLYFSPGNYGRILATFTVGVVGWIGYRVFYLFHQNSADLFKPAKLIEVVNMLAVPQVDWLPTNWVARCFGAILNQQPLLQKPELHLLMLTPLLVAALAYVCLLFMFDTALERERGAKSKSSERNGGFIRLLQLGLKPGHLRALIFKEFAVIFRETAQVVQLLLLLSLGCLYIYNLETLASASEFTRRFDLAWTRFLAIVSLAVGCFFVLAISTRIIFPSISLEGRGFWVLMSHPLVPKQILRVKFWIWFIPLGFLSAGFFILSAMALQMPSVLLPSIFLFGVISAYGVVGLAIGMGAKFANFDWEYSTQLVASFGSILYMLTAITLLTFTCIPFALLVLIANYPTIFINMDLLQRTVTISTIVLGIWLPHVLAVDWSMSKGISELKSRLN